MSETTTASQEIHPAVVPVRELIEAGVHYGHQTKRWNPRMRPYIFGTRDGLHIIDLSQTQRMLRDAYNFVSGIAARGGHVLFVGTKAQARSIIEEEATRAKQFFVVNRWLGGMLTNWETIKTSIERLRSIERMKDEGTFLRLTKKEALKREKERIKLEQNLGGIKNMEGLPSAIFIVDPRREKIAVDEARKLNIPIVAITDTNCNPDRAAYPIPGNDDAIRAIKLFTGRIADACLAANAMKRQRDQFQGQAPEGDTKVVIKKKPSRPAPAAPAEQA